MLDFLSAWCKIQLNCCVVLQHPPDIEVLRICSRGLQTAEAGMEHVRSAADLLEVNKETRVKPISSTGVVDVTQRTHIQRNTLFEKYWINGWTPLKTHIKKDFTQ